MQRLWLVGVALGLVAALVPLRAADAQGAAPAPLAVVAAGLAAVNAGDVAALTGLTAETTSLELLTGRGTPACASRAGRPSWPSGARRRAPDCRRARWAPCGWPAIG